MSAELWGGPVTVPVAAKSLQELLGNRVPQQMNAFSVTLRAGPDNTGIVWFGKGEELTPVANQLGYLLQGEDTTLDCKGALYLRSFFLVGNGTDLVYVAGVD